MKQVVRQQAPLVLLPVQEQVVTVARHKVEWASYSKPHLYPLEKVEVARKLPLALHLRRRVLLTRPKEPFKNAGSPLNAEFQLLHDLRRAVNRVKKLHKCADKQPLVRRHKRVPLPVRLVLLVNPALAKPSPLRLKTRPRTHVMVKRKCAVPPKVVQCLSVRHKHRVPNAHKVPKVPQVPKRPNPLPLLVNKA